MKLNKWIIIAIVLALVGLTGISGIFIFRDEVKGIINSARSERLEERARDAFTNERWAEASRLGQAAFYLDSSNREIQLIVARSQLKQRMASAVGWWRLVIEEPDLPVDELRFLTEALLRGDSVEETIFFLNRLLELDGDNPETQRLWISALNKLRRHGTVAALAGQLVSEGSDDWAIHQTYMRTLQNRGSGGSSDLIIQHLKTLLGSESGLSLDAARELVVSPELDSETRMLAIGHLKKNGVDNLDKLYASSAEVRETGAEIDTLYPLVDSILEEAEESQFAEILRWANWMDALGWYLDRVEYSEFVENGGSPESYFSALLREQRYQQVMSLTETLASSEATFELPILLYRSEALEATGNSEQAMETLELAVETVNPERSYQLEISLIQDGHWNLVSKLYDIMLREDPDDHRRLMKSIGSKYYIGELESAAPMLAKLELGTFEMFPDQENFLVYLKLLESGYTSEIHQHLESLLVKYPEIFDFRLTLGISYLLQGQPQVGREMLDKMPNLGLNAPRYLRVAALILGQPDEDLMLPAEIQSLTPRERFLISLP